MPTFLRAAAWSCGLAVAILGAMEIGWRWGRRETARGESAEKGVAGIDAGVYALLGLLLAFAFGSAQARLEMRRAQIVEEINAVGTAWARPDLLPDREQPALREIFRRYLDSRRRVYAVVQDRAATERALADSAALQDEAWRAAVKACRRTPWPAAALLLPPAVNAMIDATTARTLALDARTSPVVLLLLWALAPLCALLAGYAMADRRRRSPAHILLFTFIVSVTFYVIVDLDSPRWGLIRLSDEQRMLEQLRSQMR